MAVAAMAAEQTVSLCWQDTGSGSQCIVGSTTADPELGCLEAPYRQNWTVRLLILYGTWRLVSVAPGASLINLLPLIEASSCFHTQLALRLQPLLPAMSRLAAGTITGRIFNI